MMDGMLLVIDGIITIWKLEVSFLSSILYMFIYTYMYIYIYIYISTTYISTKYLSIYLSIYIYTHMYLYISPKIKKTKQIKSNQDRKARLEIHIHRDRSIDRQIDKQIDRQIDSQILFLYICTRINMMFTIYCLICLDL